jgi:hypothetical protein
MDMMRRCELLRKKLERKVAKNGVDGARFDMLGHYRTWWDKQGIDSETENGWPKEFVFREDNINRFIREEWSD